MGICACFSAILVISIILYIVRMLSVSFQVSMLIVYLLMAFAGAPLMTAIIVRSLVGEDCGVPLMIASVLEIALTTVFSTLIIFRSVKSYRLKLIDTL